ncbi:putative integron gene cassette protein [Usnea florida]
MDTEVQHKGSCHCKKITFEIRHSSHLELSECNCSICAMKGFQGFVIEKSALTSLEGRENLEVYRFGTGTAQHMFCKTCGISPLTVPRSYPEGYNINYRCLGKDTVTSVNVTPRDGQNWEQEMAKGNAGKH